MTHGAAAEATEAVAAADAADDSSFAVLFATGTARPL